MFPLKRLVPDIFFFLSEHGVFIITSFSSQLWQVRYEEIMSDSGYLDGVLAQGARNAADIADSTLNNIYQAMGFFKRQ